MCYNKYEFRTYRGIVNNPNLMLLRRAKNINKIRVSCMICFLLWTVVMMLLARGCLVLSFMFILLFIYYTYTMRGHIVTPSLLSRSSQMKR